MSVERSKPRAALGAETIVPGHGPVCTLADLDMVKAYVHDIPQLVRDGIAAGKSREEVAATAIPERYRDLEAPQVFGWNMNVLYQRFSGETVIRA